jgi:hypothetical protein
MDTISIFDLLPDEEAQKYKPIKSTDWKWTMAEDYINVSTFPSDYDYEGASICYITCMSVPPIMIKRIVTRLIESGVFQ